MTEENKDSTQPKLRLSGTPKEPETEARPEAKQAAAPKPDLKLKRPAGEPQSKEPGKPAPKEPVPQNKTPADLEKPSVQPTDEKPFDPENPFAGIEVKQPKAEGRQPPNLPSKPAPTEHDGSGRKVEEAISQIGDEKKSHGILTSIVIIFILLAILGGSGYGLYYILRSPTDTTDAPTAAEEKAEDAGTEEASDTPPSGPITKAKAAIAKMQNAATDLEEEKAPAPIEQAPQEVEEVNEPEATESAVPPPVTDAKTSAPPVDSSQTDAVSAILQSAHVGGVRTGDRPKLILNGQSYNKGDLVDPETGLRFIGLRDKKLAFQDAQGVVYIKSF